MKTIQKIKYSASVLTLGLSLIATPAFADMSQSPTTGIFREILTLSENPSVDEASPITVFEDYFTRGGNGSGGGAGLGGVYFVDTGENLTLNNVHFLNNSVKGGDGGGPGRATIDPLSFDVRNLTVSVDPVGAIDLTLNIAKVGDALVIRGASLSQSNSLIDRGANVSFNGDTPKGVIRSFADGAITFNEAITIANTDIRDVTLSVNSGTSTNTITIAELDRNINATELRAGMTIYGEGIAAGTRIESLTFDENNKVSSIKLTKATEASISSFKVIKLDVLEVSRFSNFDIVDNQFVALNDNQIRLVGDNPGLSVGMELSGNGIPAGTTIQSIVGNVVTLSNDITAIDAKFSASAISAKAGSDLITLPSGTGKLAVGMKVSGVGIDPDAVIVEIIGNKVKLSHEVCGTGSSGNCSTDLANAISNNQLNFTFNPVIEVTQGGATGTIELASLAGLKVNDLLTGSGIPANAVITGIDPNSKTVTYKIDANAANLLKGGAMNGLTQNSAGNGNRGPNGSQFNPILGDGEGQPGLIGGSGAEGNGGAGGNGGNGGNGSDGIPFNTEATLGLISATVSAANATAEFSASLTTAPFPLISMATAKAIEIGLSWAEVARSAAALAKWNADLAMGTVGLGGDGGDGGEGGAGDTFFGGGAGGDGGNGGNGATSGSQGGLGGNGGKGGAGGFGAGGGSGGAGGSEGQGGNAAGGDAGEGGRGGFGAGDGSNGNGLYGGGGSGFGGAIFVRTGGSLTLTGDVLFRGNEAHAGSSNNGGEAGDSAGSDLFMMKYSTVTLRPGAGKTIRFEGSIADDSKASFDGGSYAAGSGADIRIEGPGLVQFAGENTYSGATKIFGGTLEADDGVGIHASSRVQFEGTGSLGSLTEANSGVWLTSGTITRPVSGQETSRLRWEGSGGFAATEEGLTLNFGANGNNNGPELKLGANGFAAANHVLTFGSSYGTGAVTLVNGVNLNGQTGQIAVFDNEDSDDDHVHFAGAFRNGALNINDATFDGTAYFTAQNSLTGLTLNSGTVSTNLGTKTGRLFDATNGGDLTINGGLVKAYSAEKIGTLDINLQGAALFLDDLTTNTIDNEGKLVTADTVTASSVHNKLTGGFMAIGDINVTNGFTNDGNVALAADLTAGTLTHNGKIALIGNYVNNVETAATRTISVGKLLGGSDALILASRDGSTVQNGLILENAGRSMFQGSIRSGGNVTITGGGDLWLTGAQQLAGTLNINNATLTMLNGSSLTNFGLGAPAPTLAVVVGAGGVYRTDAIDNLASLTNNHSVKITNSINVLGNLTQNAGITDVNGTGRLTVGGITGTGGEIRIGQNAVFTANQTANSSYSGKITGLGATFTKNGAGDLTLNGAANSISVSFIDIQGGRLTFDGAGVLGSDVSVNIGTSGTMALLNGDQSIKNLTGTGLLDLNGNRLLLTNGGNFSGTITGAGMLDFMDGVFDLPSSIISDASVNIGNSGHLDPTKTPPMLNVGPGRILGANILNIYGILNADGTVNANVLNLMNRLNLSGSVNAGTSHIDGGRLHLLGGQFNSDTTLINNGGIVTGNGRIGGITTVGGTTVGTIAPGNSPGVQAFDALILDNMSHTQIELAGTAGAGFDAEDGGFDQIRANKLTINSGATMSLEKLEGYELELGESAQILQVTPSKIAGKFTNITSDFDNAMILNLSNGTVIGLGEMTANQFANAIATTANDKAIVEQLRFQTEDGVDQYRGGSLMNYAANALANNGNVAAVFAKASPEAYAGLIDHMKLSMIENLDDMGGYDVAEKSSVAFTGSVEYASGKTKDTEGYVRSKSRDYRFNLGVMADLPVARVHLSYGRTDGSIGSQNMDVDAKGNQINLNASIPFALDGGLRLTGRAAYGDYKFKGSRITNAGSAKLENAKGQSSIFGAGLEYYQGGETTSFTLAGEVLSVSEKLKQFGESGVGLTEALTIAEAKDDYLLLRAKAEVEHGFSANVRGFVKLGIDHDVSADDRLITARYGSDDVDFTVRGAGLDKTRFKVAAGSRINLTDSIQWTLEGHVGNAPAYGAKTGIRIIF